MTNTKPLRRIKQRLHHIREGRRCAGPSPGMWGNWTDLWGNCTDLRGDCSDLWGDCTGLSGNCTNLWGDCSDLWGDCTDLWGDLDLIPQDARPADINDFVSGDATDECD